MSITKAPKTKEVKGPKYPRVMVSPERHAQLKSAADRKGISLQQHAEAIFKRAAR